MSKIKKITQWVRRETLSQLMRDMLHDEQLTGCSDKTLTYIRLGYGVGAPRHDTRALMMLSGVTRQAVNFNFIKFFQRVDEVACFAPEDSGCPCDLSGAAKRAARAFRQAGLRAVPVQEMRRYVPFFDVEPELYDTLAGFFKFLATDYYIVSLDGAYYFSEISRKAYDAAVKSLREALAERDGMTREEVASWVYASLADMGDAYYLVSDCILKDCLVRAIFYDQDGTDLFMGYANYPANYVKAVLRLTDEPLPVAQIVRDIKRRFGVDVKDSMVLRVCISHGISFGHTCYGNVGNAKLSDAEQAWVTEFVRKGVEDGVFDRHAQLNCSTVHQEILRCLAAADAACADITDPEGLARRLTVYEVDLALRIKSRYARLGRFIWGLDGDTAQHRINTRELAIEILSRHGIAMKTDALYAEMSRHRDLGLYFQLHADGNLVRRGEYWALKDWAPSATDPAEAGTDAALVS